MRPDLAEEKAAKEDMAEAEEVEVIPIHTMIGIQSLLMYILVVKVEPVEPVELEEKVGLAVHLAMEAVELVEQAAVVVEAVEEPQRIPVLEETAREAVADTAVPLAKMAALMEQGPIQKLLAEAPKARWAAKALLVVAHQAAEVLVPGEVTGVLEVMVWVMEQEVEKAETLAA